jgi:ubiquinone/menaquinone biosynthesis C-methylase UbiE
VDLAQCIADQAGHAVLETACGTGILTRHLRERLAPSVRLIATDLNPPMIDYARAKLDGAGPIEWQQADCTRLPFPSDSFSALACQFGLMFVPDKGAAFREARRVLCDGGLVGFNVWDGQDQNPFVEVTQATIAEFFPENPPRFFDVPYGFGDPEFWRELLDKQGFTDLEIVPLALEARSPTARDLATGLVCGTPMSSDIKERGGDITKMVEAVAAALARHGGEAPFRSTMRAFVFTALAG